MATMRIPVEAESRICATTRTPSALARYRTLLRVLLPVTALLLGAFQAFVNRHYMNPDGIAYLDMGDAIVRGDWHIAVNGYWSPLYALALGMANRLTHAGPEAQFPLAHLVNWLFFVAALASFAYFWRSWIGRRRSPGNLAAETRQLALWLLGYALFLWCALILITLAPESPDMGVAAAVFLAAGLLVRIHKGKSGWLNYALLGVVLGIGYLDKAVLFVLGFVFLACSLHGWRSVPKVALAAAIFVAISAPWVVAISYPKGRFTFGDSGRLNLLWNTRTASGDAALKSALAPAAVHPPRVIFRDPLVYDYTGPIKTSYPFWYDPSYWLDGVKPHLRIRRQIGELEYNSFAFLVRSKEQYWAAFAFVVLLLQMQRPQALYRLLKRAIVARWYLLVIGIAGVALYSLVIIQNRYIAPFILLVWAVIFTVITRGGRVRELFLPISLTLALVMTISLIVYPGLDLWFLQRQGRYSDYKTNLQVARELHKLGIGQGQKVASVGNTFVGYWTRLAGVSVVAEVSLAEAPRFWETPTSTQEYIMREFARRGVRAVITDDMPLAHAPSGWHRVGSTNFFVMPLQSLS